MSDGRPVGRGRSVAIVTGAAGGIGRAIAVRLAADYFALGITDIDPIGLAGTATLVREAAGDVVSVVGDLCDPASVELVVRTVARELGGVDALVNNAGISLSKTLLEHSIADFDRLMRTNVLSCILMTQSVIPVMQSHNGGSIVNIASVSGMLARQNGSIYGASKAAVLSLTRSTALEHSPMIRCNAVCPGGVETPMATAKFATFASRALALQELAARQLDKRYAKPSEIAGAVSFLLSAESSFMTGSTLTVDGGWTAW